MLIRVDGQVARLKIDPLENKRVDRKGLVLSYVEVRTATSKKLRKELETQEKQEIHLCRKSYCECKGDGRIHCTEYAVLDAGAIADLGAHANISACRLCTLCARISWTSAPRM